jgi:hypothetical protein
MLAIGAAAAWVAALLGLADSETAGHSLDWGSTAWTHRSLGLASAAAAATALWLGSRARARPARGRIAAYRAGLLAAAIFVGAAGHFGGMLVYGEGYLGNAWREVASLPASASRESAPSARRVDFAAEIAPILGKRCFSCHSGAKPESDFLLTSREAALRGGKTKIPAIVPGDAERSRLIQLVSGKVANLVMPPKGKPLSAGEIDALRRWIDAGAPWADPNESSPREHWHWAYRAPKRENPPAVRDAAWGRSPIDAFVLARLEQEGLAPSPEAARETLARRASLDIVGLPPTVEELDAFLADPSPAAYEAWVDRLLASPHFGERWARPWLDLARYADTNGYEKDARRSMWPYREWVIDALNKDMPFDRFTIEQIAGDLLPNPTEDQIIATGFHRNTMVNEEGGVDPEEFRADAVIDRVNTTASVWLGSTLACAQCHDHKFDPFTQKDYYQFFALFNTTEKEVRTAGSESASDGPMQTVVPPLQRADAAALAAEITARESELAADTPALRAARESWESSVRAAAADWTPLRITKAVSSGGAALTPQKDGSVAASGATPETDTYLLEGDCQLSAIGGIRLELLVGDGGHVGRAAHGNLVLSTLEVAVAPREGGDSHKNPAAEKLRFATAAADFAQGEGSGPAQWPAAGAIDAKKETGWALGPRTGSSHLAVFAPASPLATPGGSQLSITLDQAYGGAHTIARFRISVRETVPNDPGARPVPPEIAEAAATERPQRSEAQSRALDAWFREREPSLAPARAALAELRRRAESTRGSTLVMREAAPPRESHIFQRGSFLSPGERVEPAVPALFPPLAAGDPKNRLGLARWLVDPKNPLTARVEVNRLWETIFGRGLVETLEDFGTRGDDPTHPELLDWLATELVLRGWSLKAILREIVTSSTYRQDSRASAALLERDPNNRLLARAPRLRLEAEMIRDSALTASGLLHRKLGGPSVFPPQPPGIWTMIYSADTWQESAPPENHRRGLYTFARRTAPFPTFAAFDAPSREACCTRRPRTNTPIQALTTLNDPAFVEAAVALAARMMARPGGAAEKLDFGFRACLARRPDAVESGRLLALFAKQNTKYAAGASSAEAMIGNGRGAGRGLAASELAAWSVVANVLLNLDEFLDKP